MPIKPYNREAAVNYAHKWAKARNPQYANFDEMGGDCTNYASQCLFAGTGVMNYTKDTGWYYAGLNNRAAAWTSVIYLYNFLVGNKGPGPFGREASMHEIAEGDLVQLKLGKPDFQHTPVIVSVGKPFGMGSILVAAHSLDSDYRPLDTYDIHDVRFIHIDGYRA
ncbi:MAG: amidase domain-containing protein [Clostridiales bacterium]|jgi:hypothetical protein|nr:amidase domain-containing protein [Clostridiales bacterium]